jgi:hypothetical protein
MERYEVDRLQEYVRCRLGGRVQDFRLLMRDNGLVLQGHSRSAHDKQLAQEFVVVATYVPVLVNEIRESESSIPTVTESRERDTRRRGHNEKMQ